MIDPYFQTLTGFPPRQYQRETIAKILNQENTILRAPTGAGKTETAIAPYLFAQLLNPNFPRKLIYVVPLRTLANSLRQRTEKLIKNWNPALSLNVTLQTGENPEDPRFEGDIIFCTIDQMLSSFLNIPYSVGRGSANINPGVFFASYLVFDEIHLLDPDRSFTTLIEVLKQVKGISPFLLMTATLTDTLAQQLQQEIDIPHLIRVGKEDLQTINGDRARFYQLLSEPLTAATILGSLAKRQIIICNTVSAAQALFQELEATGEENTKVTLLHARFLPEDRHEKEVHLSYIFGLSWQPDGYRHILIATQVIEAGLNLTCDILYTQLCPMNSLLQRGGRCARFADEVGTVFIYRAIAAYENPEQEADKRQFLPYNYDICQKTWEVLTQSSGEQPSTYYQEEDWINAVHGEDDQLQYRRRQNNRAEFANNFQKALFRGEESVAGQLIRDVQSRSLFVWEESPYIDFSQGEQELNPQKLQSFSVPLSTLQGIFGKYKDQLYEGDWLFKRISLPQKKGSHQENYSRPICTDINSHEELKSSFRILVNPKYLYYDREIGLIIGLDIEGNQYTSPPKPAQPLPDQYRYRMDTYTRHLFNMGKCWRDPFTTRIARNGETQEVRFSAVRDELFAPGGKFIQTKIFPQVSTDECSSLFEILVILAIFTHDLGKLQIKWQNVMRGWQEIAYRDFQGTNPQALLLAHTDYNPEDGQQKQALQAYEKKNRRPSHAVESAFLSREILKNCLFPLLETRYHATREQVIAIAHTIIMASGRHHSAWSNGWKQDQSLKIKEIQLHPAGRREIIRSWKALRQFIPPSYTLPNPYLSQDCYETQGKEFPLARTEIDLPYLQLYLLVARALRLCDQRSVH